VDDLRWDGMNASGQSFSVTPNIDRLARDGILFSNAFVVSSVCAPGRASILTGLYPHDHGTTTNAEPWNRLDANVFSTAKSNGHRVGFVGKWHLKGAETPPEWIDRWVSWPGQGEYLNPTINIDGEDIQHSGHLTDILTDHADRFLRESADSAFFLTLSYRAVHGPRIPLDRHKGALAAQAVKVPTTFDEPLAGKPAFVAERAISQDSATLQATIRRYYEMLAGVDDGVGNILATLEELDLLDETLIILTSDNGYMLGEHHLFDKRVAYEESIRVPLIVRWPSWFGGGRVSARVALNVDIAPTIAHALTGEASPRGGPPVAPDLAGYSLKHIADGGVDRLAFLYEYHRDGQFPETPPLRAIRTRRYKYVTYLQEGQIDELYDLEVDPIERTNLIGSAAHKQILKQLRQELERLRSLAGDMS